MQYEFMFGERPPGMPASKVFVVALVISEELLGESDDIDSATEQANMLFQNEVDVQVRPLSEGIPC